MADFTLSLGDVDFADFEIPDSISGGGGQSLETHKYGGGQRTVDTFGPDDDAITWKGVFLDGTAEARCQQLDAMRKAGAGVPLSYSSFSYVVVIKSFTWDFEKYYQIPYSITLEVVQDNVQPVTEEDDQGDESDMQGDLDDSNGYSSDLTSEDEDATAGDPISEFSTDMGTITNDVSNMPSITGGSVPELTQLSADISTAQGTITGIVDTADTDMDSLGAAGNFASGTSPQAMVASLTAMASNASQLSTSFFAQNSLTKLGKSVADVLTGG